MKLLLDFSGICGIIIIVRLNVQVLRLLSLLHSDVCYCFRAESVANFKFCFDKEK